MKLLLESLMVFLGTLIAAVLIAFGEPARGELSIVHAVTPAVADEAAGANACLR